jgi:hypothetical protein
MVARLPAIGAGKIRVVAEPTRAPRVGSLLQAILTNGRSLQEYGMDGGGRDIPERDMTAKDPAAAGGDTAPDGLAGSDPIVQSLRAFYDSVSAEETPERFRTLLARLAEGEAAAERGVDRGDDRNDDREEKE